MMNPSLLPPQGGTLGFRMNQYSRLPSDLPRGPVPVPAATSCHDLEKVCVFFLLLFLAWALVLLVDVHFGFCYS